MKNKIQYKSYFQEYFKLLGIKKNIEKLNKIETEIKKVKKNKSKIILIGNGGSAATAGHLLVDFTKQARIKAINFNEISLITAFANDYGFENYIYKALEFYAHKKDLVIFISVSGNSKNLVNGIKYCRKKNIKTISFTGSNKNNKLNKYSNIFLHIPSYAYNIVECMHLMYLTYLVDKIIGRSVYKVS